MIETIDWNDLHRFTPSTVQDANLIGDIFELALSTINTLVEKENLYLRNGKIEDALALLEEKQKHSVDYARASDLMRRNLVVLTRLIPARMPDLKDKQITLMDTLGENAKLISTIRALSEHLLRGVAEEAHAKSTLSTYGQNGRANRPGPRSGTGAIIVSTNM